MWCWKHTERIRWIERKTNEEVLGIIKNKMYIHGYNLAKRCKMVGHALRQLEELHSTSSKLSYRQIKNNTNVKIFNELK